MEFLKEVFKLIETVAWPSLVFWITKIYMEDFRLILKRLQTEDLKAKFLGSELEIKNALEKNTNETIKSLSEVINPLPLSQSSKTIEETIRDTQDRPNRIIQADIDGDGISEIIISQIEGAYCSKIRIFKIKTNVVVSRDDINSKLSFDLIGEINANFLLEVEDIDSDGQAEIITNEDNRGVNLPHAAGYRERVTYKWISGKITEISREALPPLIKQSDINQFAIQEYKVANERMNNIFEEIVSSFEKFPSEIDMLKEAQKAWLNFRELQAKAITNLDRGREGSIKPMIMNYALLDITRQRIRELEKIKISKNTLLGDTSF